MVDNLTGVAARRRISEDRGQLQAKRGGFLGILLYTLVDSVTKRAGVIPVNESFATTHWSLVLAAGKGASADAQEALANLCQTYWYPLYAYVRRQGHQPDDAQDLTQAFFARLLEKHYLQSADPERGRFRSFLLTAFKRFLSKEHDRERTKRRGGGMKLLPLDFEAGERRYTLEPAHEATAEKIYEQRWALTLFVNLLGRGLVRRFQAVPPFACLEVQ